MYKDTVTVFCRKKDSINGGVWYPYILHDVNVNMDKGTIAKIYGDEATDNVILNVRYKKDNDDVMISDLKWLPPKEWQRSEDKSSAITFSSGGSFDFFWIGEWAGGDIVPDDNYGNLSFYDYMQRNYDFVFAITSVGYFSVIPHFEITGK